MSDLGPLVQRELQRVELRPFTLDGFHRRRDRKRRNRRITAGAIALAMALAATALVVRAFDRSGERIPARRIIFPPGSIAFVGRGPDWNDSPSLFVVDPKTQGLRVLVGLDCSIDGGGVRSCPGVRINGADWSPDGTRLAYSIQQTRGFSGQEPVWTMTAAANGIHVLDLRTGVTRQLTHCREPACHFDGTLAWSPDGSTIAYTRSAGASTGIWTMRDDGSNRRRLPTGSIMASDPAWSPDGTRIAFAGTASAGPRTLFTMRSDGSGLRSIDIRQGPSHAGLPGASGPAWSPDGTRVAFVEGTAGPLGRLWVARIDGTGARQIAAVGRDVEVSAPSWSPDGTRIAVIANGRLVTVGANGTGLRKLTRAWSTVAPAWYPGH
jgi:Tol biopolymer transport system component